MEFGSVRVRCFRRCRGGVPVLWRWPGWVRGAVLFGSVNQVLVRLWARWGISEVSWPALCAPWFGGCWGGPSPFMGDCLTGGIVRHFRVRQGSSRRWRWQCSGAFV